MDVTVNSTIHLSLSLTSRSKVAVAQWHDSQSVRYTDLGDLLGFSMDYQEIVNGHHQWINGNLVGHLLTS